MPQALFLSFSYFTFLAKFYYPVAIFSTSLLHWACSIILIQLCLLRYSYTATLLMPTLLTEAGKFLAYAWVLVYYMLITICMWLPLICGVRNTLHRPSQIWPCGLYLAWGVYWKLSDIIAAMHALLPCAILPGIRFQQYLSSLPGSKSEWASLILFLVLSEYPFQGLGRHPWKALPFIIGDDNVTCKALRGAEMNRVNILLWSFDGRTVQIGEGALGFSSPEKSKGVYCNGAKDWGSCTISLW